MNKEITLTRREKNNIVVNATKDESIDMLTMYKLHYTRFGSKRSFFFALRRNNLIASASGTRLIPTAKTEDLFFNSDEVNVYRLSLQNKQAFGERYKSEIRQVMECLETQSALLKEREHRDFLYFAQDLPKTIARQRARKMLSENMHDLYDLNKSIC